MQAGDQKRKRTSIGILTASVDAVIPKATRGIYDQNMIDHNVCCMRTELLNVHSVLAPIQHLRTNSPIQGMTNPCVWTGFHDPRLLTTLVPKVKTTR